MEGKKRISTEMALWIGLAVLIAFVVITSIVVHVRKEKLKDLKDANDEIKDVITEETPELECCDYDEIIIYIGNQK